MVSDPDSGSLKTTTAVLDIKDNNKKVHISDVCGEVMPGIAQHTIHLRVNQEELFPLLSSELFDT